MVPSGLSCRLPNLSICSYEPFCTGPNVRPSPLDVPNKVFILYLPPPGVLASKVLRSIRLRYKAKFCTGCRNVLHCRPVVRLSFSSGDLGRGLSRVPAAHANLCVTTVQGRDNTMANVLHIWEPD